MGYTDKDWLAINTIRILAVRTLSLSSSLKSQQSRFTTPPPLSLYPAIVNNAETLDFFLPQLFPTKFFTDNY
ncbi:hypothetical protein F4809DRAFT_586437 [Biscogniauxia mediterranea]|nr:hypothetical protein F4809DRAFT_586437 [Biscogniauxia mediterranea]